ncbi:MAG TPA: hypothetical protein VKU82_01700 [Planctomycetaceae bacterium]|nr:hypothetical protein [Planctomycetaceae bacterium]
MRLATFAAVLLAALVALVRMTQCQAGMPALLPTNWTADNPRPSGAAFPEPAGTGEAQLQAISFFLACLLVSAWGVKVLWNSVRSDFPAFPKLRYGRALSLVLLWGLCFIIVLTMISGARELMTPGAWKKQGWTYTLAETKPADGPELRRAALERLRFALWQHAATHDRKFPSETEPAVDPELWQIPGWAGLRFLYVPNQMADEAGRLLVFEPELSGDERLVLLTNGLLGSLRTSEIERRLAAADRIP